MFFMIFGGLTNTIFIEIPPENISDYLESIMRIPAIISSIESMPMRRLSGRNMESNIPRPTDKRHIPTVNESFFTCIHLLLISVILYV